MDNGESKTLETSHLSNFAAAIRSRKSNELVAEALQGHLSTSCCHMANTSHRLGKQSTPEDIRAAIQGKSELSDAFERCREYLRENGVDLASTSAALGPFITFDSKQQQFVGDFAHGANKLSQRDYRRPFIVPKVA